MESPTENPSDQVDVGSHTPRQTQVVTLFPTQTDRELFKKEVLLTLEEPLCLGPSPRLDRYTPVRGIRLMLFGF